jgi:hypothetical protein
MHLKVIQQMAQMPRSVGIPPFSDSSFEQALAVGASNNSLMAAGGSGETDGRINLLAGMFDNEQYYRNWLMGRPSLVCNYHPKLRSSSEVRVVRRSEG